MPERVTIKDIALCAGVHLATAARALRNDPRISVATRGRIRVLAEEMGYRPDPFLGGLAAYRAEHRTPRRRGVLAWLDLRARADYPAREAMPELWEGARSRAEEQGWDLWEFQPVVEGVPLKRVTSILYARGIEGVLVPPLGGDGAEVDLDFSRFAAATVGETLRSPRLHRVSPNWVANLQLAWKNVMASGYRRPGLVLTPQVHERIAHHWMGAYLERQQTLPAKDRLPFFVGEHDPEGKLRDWLRSARPDVILAGEEVRLFRAFNDMRIRVPETVAVAGIGLLRADTVTGVNQRFDCIGRRLADLVIAMLHRNERGLPSPPIHILIEGEWIKGVTMPALAVRPSLGRLRRSPAAA